MDWQENHIYQTTNLNKFTVGMPGSQYLFFVTGPFTHSGTGPSIP